MSTSEVKTVDPEAQARLKRVVQRIYDLPSFPTVIQKLQEVGEDPKSTSKKMAEVMDKDQGLSAKVLKLVNSAFYSFSKPVSSLQHAITLLGYNSVRSLAMSVSMKSVLKVDPKIFNPEKFWAHSLAVGTAARLLAELNRFPLKDDAFTAGLMHDAGLLLEVKYFPEELKQVTEAVEAGDSLCEAEQKVLGIDHGLLGAWLAEQWSLPPLIGESMLRHHSLAAAPLSDADSEAMEDELKSVLGFVATASLLVSRLDLSHGIGSPDVATEVPAHLQSCLGGKSLDEIDVLLAERFEAAKAFLTV